jgi:acetyl-CoA acyltransferase
MAASPASASSLAAPIGENGITRREQDEIALASHHNAPRAWNEGFFAQDVLHVPVGARY